MIDWTLDRGNSDEIFNPADISGGWYLPEDRIAADSPKLKQAVDYILAGLGKFGFEKLEWRLRQPIGDALDTTRRPPCMLVFATEAKRGAEVVVTLFSEQDAVRTARAGGTSDGTSGARGPYTALASILNEWGTPMTAANMPPFYPLGVVAAQAVDPVGELKPDGSGIHYEVSAAFIADRWPLNEQYTRLLPGGDYQVFQRTFFSTVTGWFQQTMRPGWRQLR